MVFDQKDKPHRNGRAQPWVARNRYSSVKKPTACSIATLAAHIDHQGITIILCHHCQITCNKLELAE